MNQNSVTEETSDLRVADQNSETKKTSGLRIVDQNSVTEEISDLRNELTSKLKEEVSAKSEAEEEAYKQEIAKLIILLQRLERLVHRVSEKNPKKLTDLQTLVKTLETAISNVSPQSSRITFSGQIRHGVEQGVIGYENPLGIRFIVRRFAYAWHSPSTPLKVIHGLIVSFLIIFGSLFTLSIVQFSLARSKADVTVYSEIERTLKNQINELEIKILKSNALRDRIIPIKDIQIPDLKQEMKLVKLDLTYTNFLKRLNQGNPDLVQPEIFINSQQSQLENNLSVLERELKDLRDQRAEIAGRNPERLNQEKETFDQRLKQLEKDLPNSFQKFLANLFDSRNSEILSQILWVAAAGTLGSIVSILIRVIDQFDGEKYRDRLTPFFLGFFKPVIGAAFGVLFLAIYNSQLVRLPFDNRVDRSTVSVPSNPTTTPSPSSSSPPGTVSTTSVLPDLTPDHGELGGLTSVAPERQELFFLFAIAFVVGFSERLAKDTIGKIDGSPAGGSSSADTSAQKP